MEKKKVLNNKISSKDFNKALIGETEKSDELTRINPRKELHDAKRKARKEAVEKEEKKDLNKDIHPKEFAKALLKISEISELINKLTINSTQQELNLILKNIPTDKPILKKKLFVNIKKKTDFTISEIKTDYNKLHTSPKVESNNTGRKLTIKQHIDKLKEKHPSFNYLQYDNKIIEITNSEINLLFLDRFIPNKLNPIIICNFNLKILSKCKDYQKNTISYTFTTNNDTFTTNNDSFYNYPVMKFLKFKEGDLVKKTLGTEVIKFVFGKKGKNVPIKKAKHTTGFKSGWLIPFEDE